jgi:hypothetical protein
MSHAQAPAPAAMDPFGFGVGSAAPQGVSQPPPQQPQQQRGGLDDMFAGLGLTDTTPAAPNLPGWHEPQQETSSFGFI